MAWLVATGMGLSALGGISSSKKAEKAQKEGEHKNRKMLRRSIAMNRPFYKSGKQASNYLDTLMGTVAVPTRDSVAASMRKSLKRKYGKDFAARTREINEEFARRKASAKSRMADPNYGMLRRDFTGENLEQDPGYLFRLNEGTKALDRSASARGNLFSGAAGKALTRFNQDFASNEFQNAWARDADRKARLYNMYSGRAAAGQNAAAGMGALNQQIGQSYGMTGDIKAAGQVGRYNALTDAMGSGSNFWLSNKALNQGGGGRGFGDINFGKR